MTALEPIVIPDSDSARKAFTLPGPTDVKRVPANPNPLDNSDRKTLNLVDHLLTTARQYREPLVPRWRRNYAMTFNRFWPSAKPSWQPSPEIPEIGGIVRSLTGFMLDQRITNTVSPFMLPIEPMAGFLDQMANDLEVVLEANFVANNEEREWILAVRDSFMYGTGILKTTWDMDASNGMGDAVTRRVDPFRFLPDPNATTLDDMDFCLELKRMSVQQVDRRWPGFAESRHGALTNDPEAPPSIMDFSSGRGNAPFLNPMTGLPPSTAPWTAGRQPTAPNFGIDDPSVLVIECWVREHTHVQLTNERTHSRAWFPKNQWRVIVVADNIVVMNRPASALWGHGQHPYSRFAWDDMGEFWGPSMVEGLISAQTMYNRLLASLQQNSELTGNPVWKEGPKSTLARSALTNRPGSRVQLSSGGGTQTAEGWESPPTLQATMFQLLNFYLSRMSALSGMTDMNRGDAPGGRPSTDLAAGTQESGFVVIRQAQRFLEAAMRSAGTKRADLIIENYTEKRLVAVAGGTMKRTALALKARHFQIPTPDGAIPMKFMLNVDAGSSSMTSRAFMRRFALDAFTIGLVDREYALGALEVPGAAEIAQRTNAAMQAQAQEPAGARQRAGRTS